MAAWTTTRAFAMRGTDSPGNCEHVKVKGDGSDAWRLAGVGEKLRTGGVGIVPTDTLYAFACDLDNAKAVEKLRRIKKIKRNKPLSILCGKFSEIDKYTLGFPAPTRPGQADAFRAARQVLPGPYTCILPASKNLPKECVRDADAKRGRLKKPRRTVGVRMPDDPVCKHLLRDLGGPMLSSSVTRMKAPSSMEDDGEDDEEYEEYEWMVDPAHMVDAFGPRGLDFVVDVGPRPKEPSTVIDLTGSEPLLVRAGKGNPEAFGVLEAEGVFL
eukprot:scaffold461_cov321-Pavlova_lutheri.AAC.31